MSRHICLERLEKERIVAVVRLPDPDDLPALAEALMKGGVRAVEVTLSTPNAIEGIRNLNQQFGSDLLLGVGSVLTTEDASEAAQAGAQYVVSPIFDPDIIVAAHTVNAAAMPGCFTPTEIHRATQAGADVVKVFPADVVGMPFFKAIQAPMPHLRLMPTGGVSLDNAGDWIKAGAVAVGAGSSLCPKDALLAKDWDTITENAKRIRASADSALA